MHPRLSICDQVFPASTIAEEIEAFRATGLSRMSVITPRLEAFGFEASVEALAEAEVALSALCCPFIYRHALDESDARIAAGQAALDQAIDAARRLGAPSVYMTTGGRGRLTYEDAARVFCEAIAPSVARAQAAGVKLMLEPASAFLADITIAHTLTAATDLAERAGIGVCIDLFWCWTDADLRAAIRRAAPSCGLVQLSDYAYGDRSFGARAVPGDGDIPFERLIGWILEEGYQGVFDLEIMGPPIERYGAVEASRLGARRVASWIGG